MPAGAARDPTLLRSRAVMERNLERYPFCILSDDRGEQLELVLPFDDDRTWTVVAEDQSRLPGPFDADLYVALCQIYNHQGRPDHRTIRVPFATLAQVMHRGQPGGGFYDALEKALHRLARVSVTAAQTWKEGKQVTKIKTFHIFSSAETVHRRDGGQDGTEAVVRFSEEIAQSIAQGHIRVLDTQSYFALDTPTARRLYRYLDLRRWRGSECQATMAIKLMQLKQELPILREAPSHIKRTLDAAHQELIDQGYLETADYEERPVQGRKRGEHWVRYRFNVPKLPDESADDAVGFLDSREDPTYVEERVRELIVLLRDPRSERFFYKASRTIPEERHLGLISELRNDLRQGRMNHESARKIYTSSARRIARELGLEL